VSAGAVRGPGDVVQRRAAGSGRTSDRSPRASRAAGSCGGRRWPGSYRSETRGRERPFPGTGRTCRSLPGRIRCAGPASPHTSAPPWRVRALLGGSRRWVEARTVVRRSRSAAECTVGGEPGAAVVGRQASDGLGDRVVGRGHPGKRATGLGVLGALRRTASSGWLPWSRLQRSDASIRGTSSRRSPGTSIVAPAGVIPSPGRTAGPPAI
jgi:hypothetical protein